MKVLHICQGFFGSGLYKHFMQSTKNLGIDNLIYVPQKENYDKGRSENLIVSNKQYSVLERFLFFGKQKNSLKDIEEKINIEEIDIIHAHNLFSGGYVAYMLWEKHKIPYIIAVRGTDVFYFYKYMIHLRQLGNEILNHATNVIFISHSYKELVGKKYAVSIFKNSDSSKFHVIPNGIDEFFLRNSYSGRKTTSKDKIKLVYFGEIAKKKNLETVIKTSKILQQKGHSVEFIIIGEIGYRGFSEILKNTFVKHYNRCTKEELIHLMRSSDIFIMPSTIETFGLVYTEAMSQGLPIIYTKGQGFDGFFKQGEVGYAVNPHNYQEIADAILKIYDNYDEIFTNCIQRAGRFDWNLIANEYLALYQNITLS